MSTTSAHTIQVTNQTRSRSLGSSIRVASSFVSRGRGLMFVTELPTDSGLLIDPCSSIHSMFMRIPIDVVYVDRNNKVVRCDTAMKPWRLGPVFTGARYVIELPVGTIDRSDTQVGDVLEITRN